MDSRESELLQDLQSMGYIPPCVAEKKPFLNQKFKNLQSAFEFYREYGRVCGFDIRKAQEKSDCLGITTLKYFVCSRSGSSDTRTTKSKDDFESYKHRKQSLKMVFMFSILKIFMESIFMVVYNYSILSFVGDWKSALFISRDTAGNSSETC